jgi:hypothetical protein
MEHAPAKVQIPEYEAPQNKSEAVRLPLSDVATLIGRCNAQNALKIGFVLPQPDESPDKIVRSLVI